MERQPFQQVRIQHRNEISVNGKDALKEAAFWTSMLNNSCLPSFVLALVTRESILTDEVLGYILMRYSEYLL